MSAESTKPVGAQLPLLQVRVHGRIEAARRHEETIYTLITAPAPDQYSQPMPIEVASKKRIGGKGEEVELLCKLGGYRGKSFEAKDKETGEIIKRQPIFMTVTLIED